MGIQRKVSGLSEAEVHPLGGLMLTHIQYQLFDRDAECNLYLVGSLHYLIIEDSPFLELPLNISESW